MGKFKIIWKKSAVKDLSTLPKDCALRIINIINSLEENPLTQNSLKLAGSKNSYRIRFSDYRIIYSLFQEQLIIEIIKIAHRKDVYR
jgi:mRNA interferase RelE/StbE